MQAYALRVSRGLYSQTVRMASHISQVATLGSSLNNTLGLAIVAALMAEPADDETCSMMGS